MSAWEETLWSELEAMEPIEQFTAAGAVISAITSSILTRLGELRREAVVVAVEGGMDVVEFAEHTGSRHTAVRRLLEEGRRSRRAAGEHSASVA